MLKHEKLLSTNSTKSGAHYNFAKIQENKHTRESLYGSVPVQKEGSPCILGSLYVGAGGGRVTV